MARGTVCCDLLNFGPSSEEIDCVVEPVEAEEQVFTGSPLRETLLTSEPHARVSEELGRRFAAGCGGTFTMRQWDN